MSRYIVRCRKNRQCLKRCEIDDTINQRNTPQHNLSVKPMADKLQCCSTHVCSSAAYRIHHMIPITPATVELVQYFFHNSSDQLEVIHYLQYDCSDTIWRTSTALEMERLWFAVLKLSQGKITLLIHAISEAQADYRDVLMAAEFGIDMDAHLRWAGTLLGKRLTDRTR